MCSGWALTTSQFHVTAVCSPTRAALLWTEAYHGWGSARIRRYPVLPECTAARLHGVAAHSQRTATSRRLRQVAPHADNVQECGSRAVRPLAVSWGFDHWWGFLSGARRTVTRSSRRTTRSVEIVPEGEDGSSYYFPDDALTDKAV
ncbi:MAG: sulfatase-like hydrolase/transferase [Actinobacteria bacterium]|nr:sulfatase-like hydrolase/transferase [Actinomycetota bacterium]